MLHLISALSDSFLRQVVLWCSLLINEQINGQILFPQGLILTVTLINETVEVECLKSVFKIDIKEQSVHIQCLSLSDNLT